VAPAVATRYHAGWLKGEPARRRLPGMSIIAVPPKIQRPIFWAWAVACVVGIAVAVLTDLNVIPGLFEAR
jgi:hypothetical protein